MRRALSLQCSVAVLLAFMLAPFTHLHARHAFSHDEHHSAEGGVIHSHAGSHFVDATGRNRAELSTGDDRGNVKQLSIFQPNIQAPQVLPALVVECAVHEPATLIEGLAFVPAERAHSPPLSRAIAPRSPPA
jgi:hypothetical protein